MKPIALSFKNTSDDRELYDWIFSHSNLSGFIKDILRATMIEEREKMSMSKIPFKIGQ